MIGKREGKRGDEERKWRKEEKAKDREWNKEGVEQERKRNKQLNKN